MTDLIKENTTELGAPVARTEEARSFQREALAESTRRNYANHIRAWETYCAQNGLAPFPANATHLANYLAARAAAGRRAGLRHGTGAGQALGTVKLAYTAIRVAHKLQGLHFEDTGGVVRATLRGVRRVNGAEENQVKALRGQMIVAMISRLDLGDPTACRDAALLSAGYIFARRRSELVGLDWSRLGSGQGYITVDAFQATAHIVRHKTQMHEGHLNITVPRGTNKAAIEAIERWVKLAGIAPGTPLLRRVRKNGKIEDNRLSGAGVAYIIKRRVFEHLRGEGVPEELAHQEANLYSGHSLRHGFATTAAEAGADLNAIGKVTKHRGVTELRRYVEQADAMRVTAHNLPGVGINPKDD